MPTRRRLRDWLSRDLLYISVPALILVMGAFVVAWSCMKPAPPRHLAMALGPPGSGTRALAELLLRANGVTSASARLLPLTGLEGVAALERGTADALFLVASPDARTIREVVRARGVTLMSFSRADAYTR